jgi:hypothetical protein
VELLAAALFVVVIVDAAAAEVRVQPEGKHLLERVH